MSLGQKIFFNQFHIFPISLFKGFSTFVAIQTNSVDNDCTYHIGVNISSRAPVLYIASLIFLSQGRDPYRTSPVPYPWCKLMYRGSFMMSSQSEFILSPVDCNMFFMGHSELLNGRLDFLITPFFPHCFSWEVGMGACTIPVTRDGFGVVGDGVVKLSGYPLQHIPGDPHIIGHLNTLISPYLEFPLSRHYLSISTVNLDASIQTGLQMVLHNGTSETGVCVDTAVVHALGGSN